MAGTYVHTERRGALLLIELNRPQQGMLDHRQIAHNAIHPQMFEELGRAYHELQHDRSLFVGVLFARGIDFGGALDGKAFYQAFADGSFALDGAGRINPLGTSEPRLTKPLIAAMHGRVLSMAHELMLAATIRVAAKSTTFEQSEVTRASYPSGGATVRFPQAAGVANAMRWILTGEVWTAAEAYRMGTIQEIAEDGDQLSKALEIANTVAQNAPLAVQAAMESAVEATAAGERHAFDKLLPRLQKLTATEDFQERMQAAQELRRPTYRGT